MAMSLFSARLARRTSQLGAVCITPAVTPAATVPATSLVTSSSGASESGVKHWKYERLVSVALVGLIPAGFVCPNAVVDYGLALALPLHGHWGFGSIIEDYVSQPLKKLAYPLLGVVSIGTFLGLVYLNYNDVGICKAVQILWALK